MKHTSDEFADKQERKETTWDGHPLPKCSSNPWEWRGCSPFLLYFCFFCCLSRMDSSPTLEYSQLLKAVSDKY